MAQHRAHATPYLQALWATDTPSLELRDVPTRKLDEIAGSLLPNSRDAQILKGFLEQELALDTGGQAPKCASSAHGAQ